MRPKQRLLSAPSVGQGYGAGIVPQINTPLLLDILLGLVILLFVPFGIRRGAAKEAIVSAGILLGATLAERFGQSWGSELSARFPLDPGAATFAASALLLLGATFLLGYGGGAALGVMRPGVLSRLVGGLLAAFNAALLLTYLLGWIDAFIAQGVALDDGIVSEALLHQGNLLLLGGTAFLLLLTVLGWLLNASRARRQPRANNGSSMAGFPSRQRPLRMAPAADSGKYEPDRAPVLRSGRFGAGLAATTPLPAGSSVAGLAPWPGDGPGLTGTNGHSSDQQGNASWQRPVHTSGGPQDQTTWAAWNPAPEEPSARTEPAAEWPVAPSIGVTEDERCAVCRAHV
jgi:uncharacterized membrane protein required for colicin V production